MTGYETAIATIGSPASVSVRLNPFKVPAHEPDFLKGSTPVEWCPDGRILTSRPVFTLDPLFHAGAYYVQDSSAMFVGHILRETLKRFPEGTPLRVLDLCAAPGGKTTDAAASLRKHCGNGFTLVSNEVMRQRAGILKENVTLWGDPAVMVTSADPRDFGTLAGYFDIIIADVPCSGEGMFRKDERAVREWSEENVAMCAARQKRILADVWPALREGGVLIYSTCTFEQCENDDMVGWAAGELGADILEHGQNYTGVRRTAYGHMLVTGEVPGEGQYCAALLKTSDVPQSTSGKRLADLRFGGSAKGAKEGVPDADMALRLDFDRGMFPLAEVSREDALKFLHRDTIILKDAPKGYLTITYEGLPLGFVKNLGNRCNNLLPMGRRIRMDVK